MENGFELEHELTKGVADAICYKMAAESNLTLEVKEKSFFLEFRDASGVHSNSIVTSTDTRNRGEGFFYHTKIFTAIQFLWKGDD